MIASGSAVLFISIILLATSTLWIFWSKGPKLRLSTTPEPLSVPEKNHADLPQTSALTSRSVELDISLGLHVLHDQENAVIDVVGIHGLGAHPAHAWLWHPKNNPKHDRAAETGYPSSDVHWLRDLLPSKLASAHVPCRVMVYNYDSAWLFKARKQRLSDISDRLLDLLRNERGAIDRPIIFIGHSFGGNVIEQAIVSASRQDSEWAAVARATAGVVFLGTPHRGCNAATWGTLIATLGQRGLGSESSILKFLESHSDALTDLLHNFSTWLWRESVPVLCCFENAATDYMNRTPLSRVSFPTLVVSESSACIDGHKRMALDADHLKINKFWGFDDPSFARVYKEIERMAQRAQASVQNRRNPSDIPSDPNAGNSELYDCLKDMAVKDPRDSLRDLRSRRGKRVKNTCEWILAQRDFVAWRNGTVPQLLRLVGPPGIGKTMLSTFLVDTLEAKVRKSSRKLFAFFFCDDKAHDQSSPDALLRSLIWQLLLQENKLFKHVQGDYRVQEKGSCFQESSSLMRMLENMIQDPITDEILILIDALDECDRARRQVLLDGIHDLFQASSTTYTSLTKIIITCRQGINDIEAALDPVSRSLRIDSAAINADLQRYIDTRVDELAHIQQHGYPKEQVSASLKAGSGGTFLWASLMIADLKNTRVDRVKAKLENPLPKALPELYASILDRTDQEDREEIKFILQLMASSHRPLTKSEIGAAFFGWKHRQALTRTSQDLAMFQGMFLSIGSVILDVAENNDSDLNAEASVHFCHQSFKDFLFSSDQDAWYHFSDNSLDLFQLEVVWSYLAARDPNNGTLENVAFSRALSSNHSYATSMVFRKHQSTSLEYPFLEYVLDAVSYPLNPIRRDFTQQEVAMLQGRVAFEETPVFRDLLFLAAAKQGWMSTFRLLHEKGAALRVADAQEVTSLIHAADRGHKTIVEYLLERQDKGNASSDEKNEALRAACMQPDVRIVELLLDHDADIESGNVYGRTPLITASIWGLISTVTFLLESGARIDAMDEEGGTALIRTYYSRNEGVMKVLIERGADVNVRDHKGRTPLMIACEKDFKEAAILLIERGADVNARDHEGHTPLTIACENDLKEAAILLIERGADVNIRGYGGCTPLTIACEKDLKEAAILLIERGADVNARGYEGCTPLMGACCRRDQELVKLLIESGADVNAHYMTWDTPLFLALEIGEPTIVELLLRQPGADVAYEDGAGRTMLHVACKSGLVTAVDWLLQKSGIDVNKKEDNFGRTPLSQACIGGFLEVVERLLLAPGIGVNVADLWSDTPLHYVCRDGRPELAELLLEHGASWDIENYRGHTPLVVAMIEKNEPIVELALKRGHVTVEEVENRRNELNRAREE